MRTPRDGFSLIELLVAGSIGLLLSFLAFFVWRNSVTVQKTALQEQRLLAALAQALGALEADLQSCVVKSGYGLDGRFKPLHGGAFALQWPHPAGHEAAAGHLTSDHPDYADYQDQRCRYLGWYVSRSGNTVDRVEYYFNPGEPRGARANGLDDDGDQPSGARGLGFLVDESGCLMRRLTPHADLDLAAVARPYPDAPPALAYGAPRLTGKPGNAGGDPSGDNGEILAEGLRDVYFRFAYLKHVRPNQPASGVAQDLHWAERWPATAPGRPAASEYASDETGETWPRVGHPTGGAPRGLSFRCLPLAVQVVCVFEVGQAERKVVRLIPLPASTWNEYLRR